MIRRDYAAIGTFLAVTVLAAVILTMAVTQPGAPVAIHAGARGHPSGWASLVPGVLLGALGILLLPAWAIGRGGANAARPDTAFSFSITYRLKMSVLEEALIDSAGSFGIRTATGPCIVHLAEGERS